VDTFRYSATGVPMGIPLGDADGDGKVDGTAGKADYVKTNAAVGGGSGAYKVELDVNLDGLVTAADVTIVTANDGIKTGRGKMSGVSVAWRVGWRGMEWVGQVDAYASERSIYSSSLDIHLTQITVCLGPVPGGPFDPYTPTSIPGALCTLRYIAEMAICSILPPASFQRIICEEVANASFQACSTLVNFIPDAVLMIACGRATIPVAPTVAFCSLYAPCMSHAGINFRCMCMCGGTSPWSDWVRGCLSCGIAAGVSPTTVHAFCWAAATVQFGAPPWARLQTCGAACFVYQQVACGPSIETY